MTALWRRTALRLYNILRPARAERELARELSSHLTLLEDEFQRRGMSADDARRAARRAAGGIEQAKELHRDERSFVWLEDVLRDVRYALRTLRRSPGFAAAAVLMLAFGIGANAAVFTMANAVLFKGHRLVDRNDRLLYVTPVGISYPDFEEFRAQATSFEGVGAFGYLRVALSDGSGSPESRLATPVTANAFRVVGQRPVLGRDFALSDEVPGATSVAIVSHGLWTQRYGQDPAVIGRIVRMNGTPTTIVGVMAKGFSFPQNQDLWTPLMPSHDRQKPDIQPIFMAFGRVRDGVAIERARVETETIWHRLMNAHPSMHQGTIPIVQDFQQAYIGTSTAIYRYLWVAIGLVLLIVCANLANLLLARASGRSREMSIRVALGAGRWRIVRQVLIESVVLAIAGGALGWWIARWSVRVYESFVDSPAQLWFGIRMVDYAMDTQVLGYLTVISIGTGLVFGLAPAVRLSRLDVYGVLKDGGPGASGGERGKRVSALLVTGQVALAVVLLASAGVMTRTFLQAYTANLGFNPTHELAGFVDLPVARYGEVAAVTSFYDRLAGRMNNLPGMESVAIVNALPGFLATTRSPYEVTNAPTNDAQHRPAVPTLKTSPAYFRTLGTPMLAGRDFTDADGRAGLPVAIVNQRFAEMQWPGEDALGKQLRLFAGTTPDAWRTVIGVAPNISQSYTLQPRDPLVYVPYRQQPSKGMWVVARTRVPPGTLGAAFRREVAAVDPELPVSEGPMALSDILSERYWNTGFNAVLLLVFATMALLLASIGLYAVLSHVVSQRTQEIGIRTALGAAPGDIRTLVFREGLRPVGIGLVLGLSGVRVLTPLLKSLFVDVSPADPLTLAVASATLMVAALIGCLIPARRAMRFDPVVALRSE